MDSDASGDVIVVGGGVVGLTTALELVRMGRRVRVWTRDPTALTTSAVAGALWWPYRIDPVERVGAWSVRSLRVYEELAGRPGTGVRMAEGVHADTRLDELGPWAAEVAGLRPATRAEYAGGDGLWARLPLIDMPVHLEWLRESFVAAGGRVEIREVADLAEAGAEAPVVINCTGLDARTLVPDPSVRPLRGQLVLVENSGVTTWFVAAGHSEATSTYFFPQPGRLVLGGTAQEDAWSLTPDPEVARAIVERCAAVRPEIAGARVIGHRVGLRPTRPAVRIEREREPWGGELVHNYGHGGAGVTVAWGCAREAAGLVTG
ncbi:FAD-dependent oxidoreductase [Streptomyces sp. NPDC046821]|uniref:FAD-dependent oxidoreductase n=1 Tax=Streptomyces sp. NPDC046821 TaxID=3154702 RepID=UPI0033CAC4D1